MEEQIIYRYKNGRIIPIKVKPDKTTNEYMNQKLKKVAKDNYIKEKERGQNGLMAYFGFKDYETPFHETAERLLKRKEKQQEVNETFGIKKKK